MSIFTSIGNFIGGLFSGTKAGNLTASVYNAFSGSSGGGMNFPVTPGKSITPTYKPPQATSYSPGGTTYYNGYVPPGGSSTAGQMDAGNNYSGNRSYTPRMTATPAGYGQYMTPTPQGGGYSSGGGGQYMIPSPYRFDKASAKTYTSTANVGNLDVTGLTEEEANQQIEAKKAGQMGQVSALTSAVYSPDAVNNARKTLNNFNLSLDSINKDSWDSVGTKQDKIKNQLQATSTEIANNFDDPSQLAQAIQDNPDLQQNIEKFAKAGGTPQDIVTKIQEKQVQQPNNMATGDYIARVNEKNTMAELVPEAKLIQDRIAQEAKIPEQIKQQYFGSEKEIGYLQQRINQEQAKIDLWREKLLDEKASSREKLNYEIQKNNSEAELTRNTIKQNRLNAKNYLVGMLAKLGALNTTSAAAEGIATLDQRYEQQEADLDTKLRFANQALEIEARNKMNDYENQVNEKIQTIREDLSKEGRDIAKEIFKAEKDAEKEIFNLRIKLSDSIKKNNTDYENDYKAISEDYMNKFSYLVNEKGFNPAEVTNQLTVTLPKADKIISEQARIKDPKAIAYFKSTPNLFQDWWKRFALQQSPETYYSMSDIVGNYEVWQREQDAKKATTFSLSDF